MSFTSEQTDSSGRRYVAVFGNPNSSEATYRATYRADGTLEYEEINGQGRGTNDPAGLKPLVTDVAP